MPPCAWRFQILSKADDELERIVVSQRRSFKRVRGSSCLVPSGRLDACLRIACSRSVRMAMQTNGVSELYWQGLAAGLDLKQMTVWNNFTKLAAVARGSLACEELSNDCEQFSW